MQATQSATRRLAEGTRAAVLGLWALVAEGEISVDQFRTLAAAEVASANTAGVNLADIGLAAEVTRQLRRITSPIGLGAPDVAVDQARMARDIDRTIASTDDPGPLLGDWAASEPYLTVANTVQAGMALHGFEGWTRGLSGASCPTCLGWADGVVRPVSVSMIRHPGCDCIQLPTFST